MRIWGDAKSSPFRTYAQEPGILYGHDDVLRGERQNIQQLTFSLFGSTQKSISRQPRLYLHLFNTDWSRFTGFLREFLLPWRWKAAYLDREDGSAPERILVWTSPLEGELSEELEAVLGQPLLIANLANDGQYCEYFGKEYLLLPTDGEHDLEIPHPLGRWAGGVSIPNSRQEVYSIHRIRGIFSFITYYLLLIFSSEWEEVEIQKGEASETMLIQRKDGAALTQAGLVAEV